MESRSLSGRRRRRWKERGMRCRMAYAVLDGGLPQTDCRSGMTLPRGRTIMRNNIGIRLFVGVTVSLCVAVSGSLYAESLPLVTNVELQPLTAHVERVLQALELTGSAVTPDQLKEIRAA